jgi:predicted negative regulator of RcsB-dependent stress response
VESYRTEEEQVEALKRWWQENGRGTIIGVVLALGLGFGWQAWQKNQATAAANASLTFQQMLAGLAADDAAGEQVARSIAERLKDEYRGSTYAQFAALHLARLAVKDNNLAQAETELRWVLAMADVDSDIHKVAQLRLGRVLAAAGKTDEALGLLTGTGTEYQASFAIARGDVLLAEGREADALDAYRAAAATLGGEQPLPPGLSEKLEYLEAREPGAAEAG